MFTGLLLGYLFLLSWPPPAQAYVDPGAGSYLLQIVLGSLFALGYIVRNHFQAIKTKLRSRFKSDSHP